MTEENIDPDQEFSIQDSTEEFETGEESSNDYQPADTDFDQDSAVTDQDYDLHKFRNPNKKPHHHKVLG